MDNTRQVYVDKVLTNVFLAYQNNGFIADQLLPTLPVKELTGLAFKLDESHLRIPGSSERTGLSRANRVSLNLTQVPYGPLREHSLEIPVTYDIYRMYDAPLTPETTATNVVSGQLGIEKEVAVRNLTGTIANYPSGHSETLVGAAQWSDPTSPLEAKVLNARKRIKLDSGNQPNVAAMNSDTRDALRQHNEVKNRLVGAVAVTNERRDEIIADIFKVDRLLIAEAVFSDQAEGSVVDGNKNWVWGDDVVLAYVAPVPAIETISYGYLLTLDPKHAEGGINGELLVGVDKWDEPARKAKFIRANDYYLPWNTAFAAGYLFKDVLAA